MRGFEEVFFLGENIMETFHHRSFIAHFARSIGSKNRVIERAKNGISVVGDHFDIETATFFFKNAIDHGERELDDAIIVDFFEINNVSVRDFFFQEIEKFVLQCRHVNIIVG